MGEVYRAHRVEDFTPVVIKVMADELAADLQVRARFQREGEVLRRIPPHPHVVRVHAVGDEPSPFLIMELVPGRSLLQTLREDGPLPPLEVARIGRGIASGLEAIHRRGLIHRDIKPDNVIASPDVVKIVDFGLARDDFRTALTDPNALLGSAYYIAPEAWQAPATAPPTDLFALGATLYQLLIGRPPFLGADTGEVMQAIQVGRYETPSSARPDVPPALEHVLLQLLAPELAYRYARAADVVDDLERVLHGEQASHPRLLAADGRSFPLLIGKSFLIGTDPSAQVRLQHASVDPEHAELRRRRRYLLTDLKSVRGTFVGDEQVTKRRGLEDGDLIRCGDVVLRFEDPRSRAAPHPFLADVERFVQPLEAVHALVAARDPRSVMALLEWLAPQVEGRVREGALRALGEISGQGVDPDPARWLAWWDAVRLRDPARYGQQVGAARPAPLLLRVTEGEAAATDFPLGEQGVVLLGRDPRCHVRLTNPGTSRHHATLLRLHSRWVVRDEGRAGGTWLAGRALTYAFWEPGQELALGPVKLTLTPA